MSINEFAVNKIMGKLHKHIDMHVMLESDIPMLEAMGIEYIHIMPSGIMALLGENLYKDKNSYGYKASVRVTHIREKIADYVNWCIEERKKDDRCWLNLYRLSRKELDFSQYPMRNEDDEMAIELLFNHIFELGWLRADLKIKGYNAFELTELKAFDTKTGKDVPVSVEGFRVEWH